MLITGERAVLEQKAAGLLAASMRRIIAEQNQVVIAVPGGRSVENVLRRLEPEPVDWAKVHFFMVDERFVPLNHPDSNFRLVAACVESFADKNCLHPFPANLADSRAALTSYNRLLQDHGGYLDIVLLSSGEDGHVASLFPEHETIFSDESLFLLTKNAPKAPPGRMSASKKLICSARTALLLFFGEEKQDALARYVDDRVGIHQCPAKIVNSIADHYVLTDLRG